MDCKTWQLFSLAQDQALREASLLLRQESGQLPDPMEVMQGTLDLIILKALSAEPMHAWGISARIQRMSDDVFRIGQGSLYPAVHRFETRGWVTSHWKQTENNRIARYYELTPAGRHALSRDLARWRDYVTAVDRVLGTRE